MPVQRQEYTCSPEIERGCSEDGGDLCATILL